MPKFTGRNLKLYNMYNCHNEKLSINTNINVYTLRIVIISGELLNH